MDTFTQLSLMAKAKRVFESEDTFLSFPALSPVTCEPADLSFAAPGEMTPQLLAAMSEFARITNAIPRGAIAPQAEDEYLWDIYGDVLESAQIADGDLSPVEAARYEQARTVLYTRSPEGLLSDSDVVRHYKQHRDAHIAALEHYKNEQCTAEASEDVATQNRWRDEEEPRLRREIQHLEAQWRTEGLKAEVEEAEQVERACASRAPALIWDAWKTSFMDDLDTQTDTNLINYAVTGFAPYDCLDDAWPRFTLNRAEMNQLVTEAPRELVDVLGSSADEDIQRVSFEYRLVAVTRHWFRSALFKSRIWRLRDGDEPLSEGADLSRGRCPAYVTAIVFARNMNVERAPHVSPPRSAPPDPRANPRRGRRLRDHRDGASPPRVIRVRSGSRVRPRPTVQPRPAGTRPPATRADRAGFGSISRRGRARPIQPSAVPAASVTAPPSELTIIAYICKRVARCPDPDPTLQWS